MGRECTGESRWRRESGRRVNYLKASDAKTRGDVDGASAEAKALGLELAANAVDERLTAQAASFSACGASMWVGTWRRSQTRPHQERSFRV